MRRRLLAVLVPVLVALFGALGVPLAANIAQGETQAVYLDLPDDALRGDRRDAALTTELRRYDELYGVAVGVFAPSGELLLASRDGFDTGARGVHDGLATALAGYRTDRIPTVWPWQQVPMVVAEPVGRDSGVIAAVVTVSPTDRLRAAVLHRWAELGALGILPLLLTIALGVQLGGWVLRPVRDLDRATVAIAAGRLDARAVTVAGPPELRRLAGSFNTMVETVGRTLRRQRTFVADASHQLRNPLASLRLAVDNLGGYVEPTGRELHAVALAEAEEMGRVVDALLALTAVEGTAPATVPQPLAPLVVERAPRWTALAQPAGMTLTTRVPPDLATYAPPDALGSLLDELVGNACRLSGGTRVEVTATADGPDAVVSVRDDGVGLSADERAHAGDRFWRGRRAEEVSGTGLGLAICRELAEAWGGRLTLSPAEGGGLVVDLTLPAAGQDLTERK